MYKWTWNELWIMCSFWNPDKLVKYTKRNTLSPYTNSQNVGSELMNCRLYQLPEMRGYRFHSYPYLGVIFAWRKFDIFSSVTRII